MIPPPSIPQSNIPTTLGGWMVHSFSQTIRKRIWGNPSQSAFLHQRLGVPFSLRASRRNLLSTIKYINLCNFEMDSCIFWRNNHFEIWVSLVWRTTLGKCSSGRRWIFRHHYQNMIQKYVTLFAAPQQVLRRTLIIVCILCNSTTNVIKRECCCAMYFKFREVFLINQSTWIIWLMII